MDISVLLRKSAWARRVPPTVSSYRKGGEASYSLTDSSSKYYYLTQSDFLDELNPSSHIINSCEFRSMRPKYKFNSTTNKNELDGYEDVERVAIGLQQGIRRHKTTHTFGNDIEFRNVGTPADGDKIKTFLSYWDMAGMKDALMCWGKAFFGTGDSAIYFYIENNKIKYKVFSYENNEIINKVGDTFIRLFKVVDKEVVETYDKNSIKIWVKDFEDKEWLKRLTPNPEELEKSGDGWICISHQKHGWNICPVIYHREKDVCWGVGQDNIDRIERILSDLGDNNRYYAFQFLFLTGGVISLPDTKFKGTVLGSKSSEGKAEILKPADASNSFDLDLKTNISMLWESTGTTVINIEDLKGGDQSGAYIVNLYFRSVQWSTEKIAELRPAIQDVVDLFSQMVGILEKDVNAYRGIKMAWSLTPFVPRNKVEEITMIGLQVANGYMSKETAAEISPDTSVDEFNRLQAQAEKQKELEAAGVTVVDPKPVDNIDNKAKANNN